ncbi:unnamed protein product [Wickerhamomyces anomalus]
MEPSKWKIGSTFSSISSSIPSKTKEKIGIGEINRFTVQYEASIDNGNVLEDDLGEYLWLRVRNIEMQVFRPIYFTGPFSFYIDVTPYNFDHRKDFDEPIEFNNDIKPGQSFKAKLRLNKNSLVRDRVYFWTIDVVAQLAMTTKFTINYDFMIGYDYKLLRKVTSDTAPDEAKLKMINVVRQDTKELWQNTSKKTR